VVRNGISITSDRSRSFAGYSSGKGNYLGVGDYDLRDRLLWQFIKRCAVVEERGFKLRGTSSFKSRPVLELDTLYHVLKK